MGLELLLFALLSVVNTQPTLNQCTSDLAMSVILLIPNDINIVDPKVSQFLINWCNFYHEKTGKWLTFEDERSKYSKIYEDEFYQKYQDTIPDSIRKLLN